ncbi:MAG: ATP-binding protein [Acidimicrobiales bacterium]
MVRFGVYALDVGGRELLRDEVPVHLEPQAFDLLVHLVDQRERVVHKHELLDGVWGHRFVSESALTTRIKEIRKAVGDDGTSQHTIRNVRGVGYRFVAPVDEPGAVDRETARPPEAGPPLRLIGRSDLLDEIAALVQPGCTVTLLGPGGVGKSLLAREVARRLADARPDGMHLIELAAISSSDDVLPAVAYALDIVLDGRRPAVAAQAIAGLDAVVVLDNCEHVLDGVTELVDRVVESAARVCLVATSRVRLGCSGEIVVPVDPLEPDAAVDLFDERARAAQRGWRIDDAGADRVRALVDQLDRLPLMIEIAAARLASMTFGELESAVSHGGRLLQLSHRARAQRHRSVASLVTWSTDLLEPEQRRALERMAVFAGSVSSADAAAVLRPDEPDALAGVLAALAERSLLAVDLDGPVARYRMLDTVRMVAGRAFDEGDSAATYRRRHAAHIAAVVAQTGRDLRSEREPEARARLAELVPEVRAAHRWAVRDDPTLASRLGADLHLAAYTTLWAEPALWSASLLAQHADADSVEMTGARLALAGAAANAGRLAEARSHLDAVLEKAVDPVWRGTALEVVSDVALYEGRLEDCLDLTSLLDELGRSIGDSHMRIQAAVNSSLALTFGGSPDEGLRRAEDVDRTGASPSNLAWLSYVAAEAWSAKGSAGRAIAAFDSAIAQARAVGNSLAISVSQLALGMEHLRNGDLDRSLEPFAICLHDHARHGNLVHAVTTLRNLVEVLVALGDDEAAVSIGAAATDEALRPSYGAEAERLTAILAEARRRVGDETYERWAAAGFTLPQALRAAAVAVERRFD